MKDRITTLAKFFKHPDLNHQEIQAYLATSEINDFIHDATQYFRKAGNEENYFLLLSFIIENAPSKIHFARKLIDDLSRLELFFFDDLLLKALISNAENTLRFIAKNVTIDKLLFQEIASRIEKIPYQNLLIMVSGLDDADDSLLLKFTHCKTASVLVDTTMLFHELQTFLGDWEGMKDIISYEDLIDIFKKNYEGTSFFRAFLKVAFLAAYTEEKWRLANYICAQCLNMPVLFLNISQFIEYTSSTSKKKNSDYYIAYCYASLKKPQKAPSYFKEYTKVTEKFWGIPEYIPSLRTHLLAFIEIFLNSFDDEQEAISNLFAISKQTEIDDEIMYQLIHHLIQENNKKTLNDVLENASVKYLQLHTRLQKENEKEDIPDILMLAISCEKLEIVRYLIEERKWLYYTTLEKRASHLNTAVFFCSLDILKYLVEELGYEIHQDIDECPLKIASQRWYSSNRKQDLLNIIRYLLEKGANPNYGTHSHYLGLRAPFIVILEYIARNDKESQLQCEAIKLFLKYGANLSSVKCVLNISPLALVATNHYGVFKQILDIEMSHHQIFDATVLGGILATASPRLEFCWLLFSRGLDPNLKMADDRTIFDYLLGQEQNLTVDSILHGIEIFTAREWGWKFKWDIVLFPLIKYRDKLQVLGESQEIKQRLKVIDVSLKCLFFYGLKERNYSLIKYLALSIQTARSLNDEFLSKKLFEDFYHHATEELFKPQNISSLSFFKGDDGLRKWKNSMSACLDPYPCLDDARFKKAP